MFRKILSVIMAIAVCVVGLSGCGESPPEETETTMETEITAPSDLTEEEMRIWENMPDVVTMRTLTNVTNNITEVMYIEKNGLMKNFIVDDETFFGYEHIVYDTEWAEKKFEEHTNAEAVGTVDVHKLINFYNTFLLIDKESKITTKQSFVLPVENNRAYDKYEIYAALNNVDNGNGEVVLISAGDIYTEYIHNDPNGFIVYEMYVEIEPFRDVYGGWTAE